MSNTLPLICENKIPDRYYKLINQIDPNNWEIYIFTGQVPTDIREILQFLQKGGSLNASQSDILLKFFGINYKNILALESPLNKYPVTYLDDLIEVDDSVAAIKNKIVKYLRVLVDWQYLYINMNTTKGQELISLGHTFIQRKESKKSEDVLIEYNMNPFADIKMNPYPDINLGDASMNYFVDQHTGIKFTGYQKNDTNGTLITEYNIVNDEIYLVTFCNFLKYVQTLKIKYTGVNLNKFKYGYLAKYWSSLVLDNEPKFNELYDLCANKTTGVQSQLEQSVLSSDYKSLTDKVERDSYIVSLVKHPPKEIGDADIKFENCGILEIVLHINYNLEMPEFIDLMKIFDRYQLSKGVPFVKYKGEKSKEPRHKLFIPIIDENSIEIIQDWISNIQKRKKDDVFEYRVSGKGLSFKRLLYQNIDSKTGKVENKYATINFYKDGKIELKCFWKNIKMQLYLMLRLL